MTPFNSNLVPVPASHSESKLEKLLAALSESLEHFRRSALQFPPELRSVKPTAIAFSATEIVYHMISVEKLWQSRFASLLSGNKDPFVGLDPDADAKEGSYNTRDFELGLSELLESRVNTIAELKHRNDGDLALTGLHPKYGPMSIEAILIRMESHDRGHADQFHRTLSALTTGAVNA